MQIMSNKRMFPKEKRTEHCVICCGDYDPRYNNKKSCELAGECGDGADRGDCGHGNYCAAGRCEICGVISCEQDTEHYCYRGQHVSKKDFNSLYFEFEMQCECDKSEDESE